jgi:hypothetical protein
LLSRLRSRLTYANVVATLALFLVLGGGTALASYVVSSNSQIGPGTVSGHNPPTGKHSNIITGSVNGTDLSANSVSSPKVANHSLTGSDLGLNTVTGLNLNLTSVATALRLRDVRVDVAPGATNVFYNTGAFTLTGSCVVDGGGNFHAKVDLGASSDTWVSIDNAAGERFSGTEATPVAQTSQTTLGGTAVKGGEFAAASAQFANHLSGHVLAVANGEAEAGACEFTFEGIGD